MVQRILWKLFNNRFIFLSGLCFKGFLVTFLHVDIILSSDDVDMDS